MLSENFVQMLQESIKKNWDLPAFSDWKEGATFTYGETAKKVLWLHHLFEKSHIKRGDKIALVGRNCSHWCIVYLAAVTYGAVIVPILPDFHADDFHHIVNHSEAVLLFTAENIYEKLDEQKMPELEAIFSLQDFSTVLFSKKKAILKTLEKVDDHFLEKYKGQLTAKNFSFEPLNNDELAGILYTSGTSGFSKGVMLPYNSLAANVRFARNNIDLQTGDAILSFLPLAHSFGCAFDFLFPFVVGCHITLLGQIPSPRILIQALGEIRPRLILSVPLLIEKIYKNRLKPELDKTAIKTLTKVPGLNKVIYKKVRQKLIEVFGGNFIEIVIGGAALNEEVERFLKKIKFPFTVGYGMTECGPLISYTPFKASPKLGSVGQLMDTLEIRIDSSVTQTTDGSGEIQVRGENVMTGYFKNAEDTRATIDEDGWLHTGDIGLLDGEGFIFIKGRHKSMLLGPSGQNIYPEEIEARLNNLPYVEESLVVEKDKQIVALVYPNMEAVDAEGLNEQQLQEKMAANREAINQQLPAYSRLARLELFPEEFEKTPTKKIKRFLYTISRG
jgi:long-chain acyl-CoA synthetase